MPDREFTDWHTHLYLPEQIGPVWTDRGFELLGRKGFGPADPEEHSRVMAAAGVNRFAIVGLQIAHIGMYIPNDFIGSYLAANRDRALGIGSVDPTQSGAVEELRRAVRKFGLHGVKISPPYQGFHPHSDEAYAIYRTAADLGIFLMFHQASVFVPNGFHEYASPSLLDKVARDFRSTKIWLAHMGKPWMNETVELMMKNRNVYADLSTLPIKTWQMYTGLRLAIEGHVTDRLLFGSDFPCFEPRSAADQFLEISELKMPLPIPREVVEDILYNRPFELMVRS
ncbi:MAG TPA: amidohydrolase family protein [Candidatus Binataceae bacterium]|nr:amidohydrolase family protein [Candidatus Binataceae bacterium]